MNWLPRNALVAVVLAVVAGALVYPLLARARTGGSAGRWNSHLAARYQAAEHAAQLISDGQDAVAHHDYERGIELFKLASQQGMENYAYLLIADACERQGRWTDAVAAYRAMNKKFRGNISTDPVTRMRYSLALAEAAQSDEAVSQYVAALRSLERELVKAPAILDIDPNVPDLTRLRAGAHFVIGSRRPTYPQLYGQRRRFANMASNDHLGHLRIAMKLEPSLYEAKTAYALELKSRTLFRTPDASGLREMQSSGAKTRTTGKIRSGEVTREPTPAWITERWRPYSEAVGLATRLLHRGDVAGAEDACRKALELRRQVSDIPQDPIIGGIMGEICLRQGKNREALDWLLGTLQNRAGGHANLDVTIAYCRLGDYKNAKRYYSDGAILAPWKSSGGLSPQDLPGTGTLASLEAGALLAKANGAEAEARPEEAHQLLLAAERLAPKNPMIAYCHSLVLRQLNDATGEQSRLRVAVAARTPVIHDRALHELESVNYWLSQKWTKVSTSNP